MGEIPHLNVKFPAPRKEQKVALKEPENDTRRSRIKNIVTVISIIIKHIINKCHNFLVNFLIDENLNALFSLVSSQMANTWILEKIYLRLFNIFSFSFLLLAGFPGFSYVIHCFHYIYGCSSLVALSFDMLFLYLIYIVLMSYEYKI